MKKQEDFYNFAELVFPICELSPLPTGQLGIQRFVGTGFFIGKAGFFLTTRHVISEELLKNIEVPNFLAIIVRIWGEDKTIWKPIKIIEVENGPNNWDISIGKVEFYPSTFFSLKNINANSYGWEDVLCFGYPESLMFGNDTSSVKFNGRFLKGYITRRISAGEQISTIVAPPSYELNFTIPKGMSGSPLFKIGPDHPLVGVCLGSFESSMVIWEKSNFNNGEKRTVEQTKRIIEFGLAIRVFDLRSWKPKISNGLSLEQLF